MTTIPADDAWEPWTPAQLAARLRDCPIPWAIAGGWAIDLWLGRATRPHADIEIAIPALGLASVWDRLANHQLYQARNGVLTRLEDAHLAQAHQVWVLDPAAGKWRLDLLLDPGDHDHWVYRRNHRVRAPRAEIIGRTPEGVPYLRPQIVLLFKAKQPRPKDDLDLATSIDQFTSSERRWLDAAVSSAHPESPWIDCLGKSAS